MGEAQGDDSAFALDPRRPSSQAEQPSPGVGINSGVWSGRVPLPPANIQAELSSSPRSSQTGGVAEAMYEHDQEIGLGPTGALFSAAQEAARSADAPAVGAATFTIRVLRSGNVSVDLVDSSAEAVAWRAVGELLAGLIQRRPPRLPDGAPHGIQIAISIVAENRWPNGWSAAADQARIGISGPPLRSKAETIADTTARNPFAAPPPGSPSDQPILALNWDQLGLYLAKRSRVCNAQAGVTALGQPKMTGGCDLANLGGKAIRVVQAKVTSQTLF